MTRSRLALAALLFAGLGLAGCGKQGDLERPGPLWGPDARARAAASAADNTQTRSADGQDITPSPGGAAPGHPAAASGHGPAGTLPIEGGPPDPSAPGGATVIPDPYNNPR